MHSSPYNKQRSGQALLLAVLVMVFAALIGVTFITVVAINIGQTGREEERDKARQAAQAGLAFANLQLTNGIRGIRWRPEQEIVTPAIPTPVQGPPVATNIFYWTPFDQAQGWAGYNGQCDTPTGTCEGNFVKFPDPRSINPTINAPNYMLKVETVLEADADNISKDKTGALRITAIGLSPDDPTSFYKVVAYKAGPAQSPLTGAMRSVSNWDFQNQSIPTAVTIGSGSTSATSTSPLNLVNLHGSFANRSNFYVTISDVTGTNIRYAVVTQASSTQLTLAPTPTPTSTSQGPVAPSISWAAGERVELAAALGSQSAVDFDNNTDADITKEHVDFRISTASGTPGSIRANGGLVLLGNTFMDGLLSPRQSTISSPAGQIKASGFITLNASSVPQITGTLYDGTPGGVSTGTRTLLGSNNGAFPFAGSEEAEQKASLIDDGANRILGSPESTRQVTSFTPPNITAGGNNFGRYRELTKYSEPADPSYPLQAAAYGYGQGIYINNPEDKEKVGLGEMKQNEYEQLLFDSSADEYFLRAGEPQLATASDMSLEQQHLRGWIAPDEFLPRGALVEINPDATLAITLDSIADGPGNNQDPVPNKSWRDVNGNILDGIYSSKNSSVNIGWPKNGIIFAEGNIRIRGKATTVPTSFPSLTVVSMNNIYIEDSVGVGNKKLLLLARKNVIVNPTRIVGRLFAQTRAGAGSTVTDVVVRDGDLFNIGDRIQIGNGAIYRTVANKIGNTLVLDIPLDTAEVPANATVIRLQHDPINSAGTRPFFGAQTPYIKAEKNITSSVPTEHVFKESQAFQRRFWVDSATSAVRMAMRHGAAKESSEIRISTAGTAPASLNLGNKIADPTPTSSPLLVNQADKAVIIDGDVKSPYPANPGTATMTDLINELNSSYTVLTDGWAYNVTLDAAGTNDYGAVPYRYLAGIGLRYENNPTVTPSVFPSRQGIPITDDDHEPLMATSIQVTAHNADVSLQLRESSGSYLDMFRFGFNSNFANAEDVLTADRSFYSQFTSTNSGTNPLFAYLTTDSRQLAASFNNGFNNLIWQFPTDVMPAFSEEANRKLPYYALGRVKLENSNQYNGTDFETLEPGYMMDINAYVYAQEGSWLVIPGVYFDERLKTHPTSGISYIDLNGNGDIDAGEYIDEDSSGGVNVNEALDFNRDGAVSREEQVGLHRFLRYNYKVRFTGAIMENKSALIEDPDGLEPSKPTRGFVADWTDKWANVRTTAINFPTVSFDPSTMSVANNNYSTIEYNFDPSAARQEFINDVGFQPPVSPDLIYQTG